MSKEIAKNIRSWEEGGTPGPVKVHLMTTDRCNLTCLSCWRWGKHSDGIVPFNPDELSEEKLLSLIDEAADLGVKEIELCGAGEPFFRKDAAMRLVSRIKARGMRGVVTTNATLLDEKDARQLVDVGWEKIIVSLDGPSAELNDDLRPPAGTFAKVIRFLERLRDDKEAAGKEAPELLIQCVLSQRNKRSIADMFSLAARYRAGQLIFEPLQVFSSRGRSLALNAADTEVLKGQLDEALRLGERYGIVSNFASLINAPRLAGCPVSEIDAICEKFIDAPQQENMKRGLHRCCYEPWYRIYITNFGLTSYCCAAPYSSQETVKSKSLRDIWFGAYFSQARQKINGGESLTCFAACPLSLKGHSHSIREHLLDAGR